VKSINQRFTCLTVDIAAHYARYVRPEHEPILPYRRVGGGVPGVGDRPGGGSGRIQPGSGQHLRTPATSFQPSPISIHSTSPEMRDN
jgi:hypothetical protein